MLYVSTGAKASDANDGLTPGSPKASIASALAALGGGVGVVELDPGTYTITSVDGNGNAITLSAGQHLRSAVGTATGATVVVDVDATWAIQCRGAYASVTGCYVAISAGRTVTYGVGVSTPASTGSAQSCQFKNVYVSVRGTCTAAYALGPDWPGSSSVDIANTAFEDCAFDGAPVNGFLSGNGVSGNVTANELRNFHGHGAQYGITLSGSGLRVFGGGLADITVADIRVTHGHGDPVYIAGLRCENGNRFLSVGYVGPVGGIILDGCSAGAYTPSDMNLIVYDAPGPLTILGGIYTTVAGTATISLNAYGGKPFVFTAIGVVFDNDAGWPPLNLARYRRTILNASYFVAGRVAPSYLFAGVIDKP